MGRAWEKRGRMGWIAANDGQAAVGGGDLMSIQRNQWNTTRIRHQRLRNWNPRKSRFCERLFHDPLRFGFFLQFSWFSSLSLLEVPQSFFGLFCRTGRGAAAWLA